MSMFKYNDEGNLVLDTYEFIDSMPEGTKRDLIEALSCHDEIIEYVRQQVFEGYTEDTFLSGTEVMDDLQLSTPLQRFREEVRSRGNKMLKKEVERLRETVSDKRKHYESGWDAYHELREELSPWYRSNR